MSTVFWQAVIDGDVERAAACLRQDGGLVHCDFRPQESQDQHTDGFPLVRACQAGHLEMAMLLISQGADVNARSPHKDQREFGMPLYHAVANGNFPLANLLLEHGADPNAFPYCDQSAPERLFYLALEAGMPTELIQRAFDRYLEPTQLPEIDLADAPDAVVLFDRFLSLGGQLSFASIVRAGCDELIDSLLLTCPDEPGTQHDWPHGTVFDNVCGAASWLGYPQTIASCMEICSQLYHPERAKHAMGNAITSHNRDGSYADYRKIIVAQLAYLQRASELETCIADVGFDPIFLIADGFCWPRNYGYKAERSAPEDFVDLVQLFMDHGFVEFNARHPKSNLTPLGRAAQRGDHPGMATLVEFLVQNGADLCAGDPRETNPRLIAEEKGFAEIAPWLTP